MSPLSEPRPGDFFLVKIHGTVGWLIRLGQWLDGGEFADYEHAAVYLGDGRVMEAEPGGARVVQLSVYDNDKLEWSSGLIDLTDDQREAIVSAAYGYRNVPYSFLDYLSLALARLRIRAPFVKQMVAQTRHMICSQLVDQCYEDAGVHLFEDHRWPGDVIPADLYRLLQEKRRSRGN